MDYLKITLLTIVYVCGLALASIAQPALIGNEKIDPMKFFDEFKSEVTLHRSDGTEVKANLVYNDGSKLYIKTEGMPEVQAVSLSSVKMIEYADGSVERIYGSFGDSYAVTTAALMAAAPTPGTGTAPSTTGADPEITSGEVKLVFEPVDTRRNQFIDLMIDGEYVTTIHDERGAVVTAQSGQHDIKMNLMGNDNKGATTTLYANGNNTYTVNLPGKVRLRNIRKKNTDIDEKKGLDVNKGSSYAQVTLGQTNYKWDTSFFPFIYGSLNYNAGTPSPDFIPEGSSASVGFSMGSSFDFPVSRDQGIYVGFMSNITYMTYLTDDGSFLIEYNEAMEAAFGPTATYYFMNHKTFTPFAGIEVPFTSSAVITSDYSSTSTTPEAETGVGVNFRAGTYVFLGKSLGLVSQVRAGTMGGVSFQAGLSFRILNKKNAEHRGTYWYSD